MEDVKAHQFSSDAPCPEILHGKSPWEFLKEKYQRGCIFGLDNLQRSGVYRLNGWSFDFKPYMKQFLVKQYDSWQEYYAPNKTILRNSIYGVIQRIVEIID